jgi:hypothetical protein
MWNCSVLFLERSPMSDIMQANITKHKLSQIHAIERPSLKEHLLSPTEQQMVRCISRDVQ